MKEFILHLLRDSSSIPSENALECLDMGVPCLGGEDPCSPQALQSVVVVPLWVALLIARLKARLAIQLVEGGSAGTWEGVSQAAEAAVNDSSGAEVAPGKQLANTMKRGNRRPELTSERSPSAKQHGKAEMTDANRGSAETEKRSEIGTGKRSPWFTSLGEVPESARRSLSTLGSDTC